MPAASFAEERYDENDSTHQIWLPVPANRHIPVTAVPCLLYLRLFRSVFALPRQRARAVDAPVNALQQARIDAMLRAYISNASYFWSAHVEAIEAFNGDDNGVLDAFYSALVEHRDAEKRLERAVYHVALFGEGYEASC